MNEKTKIFISGFIIGLVIGIAGAGLFFFVRGLGRDRSAVELAAGNARATEDTIAGLAGTVAEQRAVIESLESENQRLMEHLSGAGRICESLAGTVETSGAYTASAAILSKKIRTGIEALEDWYNNVCREYPGITDMEYGAKIGR